MIAKDMLYCGKDLRKYLYVIGVAAFFILIASYWYTNYYIRGVGLASVQDTAQNQTVGDTGVNVQQHRNRLQAMNIPGMNTVAPQVQQAAMITPRGGSFARVTQNLMPSIVNVSATRAGQPGLLAPAGAQGGGGLRFSDPFSGKAFESVGSGIIVTTDGYILTNHHVVEKAREINVTVFDRAGGTKRYMAELIRSSARVELALLKIEPVRPLEPAPLGNSNKISVGDPVIAIGSPFGLDQTVSQGIISGRRNSVTIEGVAHRGLLQTDAAINRGNSGGPLVNGRGEVIGVNTAIYTPTGAFAGIGFAVPMDRAKEFMEEMINLPRVRIRAGGGKRPTVMPVAAPNNTPPPPITARAATARPPHDDRGPCENCHMITAANPAAFAGSPMRGPGSGAGTGHGFAFSPGGAVALNVANQPMFPNATAVDVTPTGLGMGLRPLTRELAQRHRSPYGTGAFIHHVQPGSKAERAGLQSGDIIFKLDGRWVKSPQAFNDQLAEFVLGQEARISVIRGGERQNVFLPITRPGAGRGRVAARGMTRTVAMQQPVATGGANGRFMQPPGQQQAPQMLVPGQPLPKAPANQPAKVATEFEWLGLELNPIDATARAKTPALQNKQGATVAEVDPGTKGEMAGIEAGDIVVAINGQAVVDAATLDGAIKAAGRQNTILLEVERNNVRMFATIQ